MSWFSGLLGKIFNSGTELALGGGINFRNNLTATLNPVTGLVDVDGADALTGSASVVVGSDIQRAALTGVVTAAQDSNTTAFAAIAARSVLLNASSVSAAPAASAPTRPLQYLRSAVDGTTLEWGSVAGSVETTIGDVTNATTAIGLCGTLTIPANTLAVGSRFRAVGMYRFTRGSTATALNLVSIFNVGPNNETITSCAANVTNGFNGTVRVEAELTVTSIGAGGAARVNIISTTDCDNVATTGKFVSSYSSAMAINTTIANDLTLTGNMSAAVANARIRASGGDIVGLR